MSKAHLIFTFRLLRDGLKCLLVLAVIAAIGYGVRCGMVWVHDRLHWKWEDILLGGFIVLIVGGYFGGLFWEDVLQDYFHARWQQAEKQAEYEACKEDAEHSPLRASQPKGTGK